ncbi:transcription factor GTE4-like [Lolium rigidum]|uniref:transcription factor GTE4-like n=1 Tax=Lolium rigidum TaxID=89674 RepID=UPI001F5E2006|nr:transcription factor GTE4-like [Lolium rigidum]
MPPRRLRESPSPPSPILPKKPKSHAGADLAHPLERIRMLLDKLLQHEDGWVFAKPVDPLSLGLSDYYSDIPDAMDLGTVSCRLEGNRYMDLHSFARDVRLTFHNAMVYNDKGDDVYESAAELSEIFESGWASIEQVLPSPPSITDRRMKLKNELPRLSEGLQRRAVIIMKDINAWLQEANGRVQVDFEKADEATLDKLERLVLLGAMQQQVHMQGDKDRHNT